MSVLDDSRGEGRFWATVIVAFLVIVAMAVRTGTPSALDASAPLDAFSAERARDTLKTILPDESPHPTGSKANDAVRQRVIDELRRLEYAPVEEEALVCTESGSCAVVRNIIAELRGRVDGPAVLLNAHYDSVPAGPGAGDDGAGVAALLEVARALKISPKPERTIRFLVDDGEEAGLLGAEAYVRQNPPTETLAAIVLEARGSSGPALMFETHSGNFEIVKAFAAASDMPATSSLFFAIYEKMPNLTNFTVFKREGYRGMAVAFVEDPAHYHTPRNDISHLSGETLQHLGDTALSMCRELAANGLADSDGNASYFDLLGSLVVLWPESWNVWMGISALLLVAVVGVVNTRRRRASAVEVLVGWAVVLIAVLLSGGITWGLSKLVTLRAGDSAWIANDGFVVVAAWCAAVLCITIPFIFSRRPPTLMSMWTAVWLLQAILGVVAARLLSGASYLFVFPALVAGLSGLFSVPERRLPRVEGMLILPFLASLVVMSPILLKLPVGLGLVVLPAVSALAAFVLSPLLVVSVAARRTAMIVLVSAAALIVSVALFAFTAPFSAETPRSLNFVHVQEEGAADATLVALGSSAQLPPSIDEAANWSFQPVDAFWNGRSATPPRLRTATTERVEGPFPRLNGSSYQGEDGERVIQITLEPAAEGSILTLVIPDSVVLREVSYGGHRFPFSQHPPARLVLRGVPSEGAEVLAILREDAEIRLREDRAGLPRGSRAIAEMRSEAEVPIGPGDRSIWIARKITAEFAPAAEATVENEGTSP